MLIIDSQAVKNTDTASVESKGFCYYKCTNGIKRHLAVDTLGLPFFTHCTSANVTDDQGLVELLSRNLNYLRAKPVNIPKRRVVGDKGYSSGTIRRYLRRRGIRFTIPRKSNERKRGKFDKSIYRQRNQVERCFNRLKQFRRIATRYEKKADNYHAMLTLASILLWL
ncbi:IS5 family transposase [Chroococcidiopsis sp. FACHB-1243]|uniref:IS5 family transposase n=1 Tax=Chroococcidiopsis sp. [FACHB-1243] TaxID=2692781 RepID=UPI0017870D13|nr:IS5 family transposase [Chroococcidiopsis sp. [FACHB-1243]]MBD2309531.1 IS5 family transposase [Chroococcidiopsis sp. [FACHB-1243]]